MAEPLVIQFAADTSRAQSALATLAAQVVGNMTQIGVAMAGGAANANGFGAALEGMKANAIRAAASLSADVRAIAGATGAAVTAAGATLQSVASAFMAAAVTSNTATASARAGVAATATAVGTVTAQLPALGQLAVGLGVAGRAYLTISAAVSAANAQIAQFTALSAEAERTGFGIGILQRFQDAAKDAGLAVEEIDQALRHAAQATTPKFEQDNPIRKQLPEGAPDVRLVADLSACYDPRDPAQDPAGAATWRWSDNAALVLLAYLHDESGYGLPFGEIDLASFVALADVCDEDVPLLRPTPDGATSEKRYRSWGTYTFDEERAAVLGRYLSACDAELDQDAQGRVTVRGGRWHAPTFTITEDMVLGWDRYEVGDEAFATFNRVKFTYKSPWHDYQPVEGDPWDDAESQAAIGIVPTERDFGRAPSHAQARRLAKIAAARGAPELRFAGLRLSPAGLPAYGEPTVRLVLPSFGIDATFAPSAGKLTGPFKAEPVLDLYSLDASAYAWSPSEEGNAPPLPDASAPAPAPIPTGVAHAAIRTSTGGQVTGLAARFTADPVAGRADLVLIGRFRPAGTEEWTDMASQDGAAMAGPLNDGEAYEAQVAWLSSTSIGAWGDTIRFTLAADTTPTGAPTGFVVNGGVGRVSYAFTAPNAANFASARLSRSPTTRFADAVVVKTFNGAANQAFDGTDARPAGASSYWVQAFNASGFTDPSCLVGPITVTVA